MSISSNNYSITLVDQRGNETHFPLVRLDNYTVHTPEPRWYAGKYPDMGPATWELEFTPLEPYTIKCPPPETREEKRRRQIREFYPKQ